MGEDGGVKFEFREGLKFKPVCRLNEKSLNFGVGGLATSEESFDSLDLDRALNFCISVVWYYCRAVVISSEKDVKSCKLKSVAK